MSLPIESVLPKLVSAVERSKKVVLSAEPGAGKTTRVPLALLNAPWVSGKIVMLEPRRIAAQSAARYMARSLGERVGETVGYRIRGDSKVSGKTRLEVVTEGVLTRYLHEDPSLSGISVLIFDEFHERSIHADLGLAFALETADSLREDLRILVMSATIDTDAVAALLGRKEEPSPVIECPGRVFPVETHYLPPDRNESLDGAVTRAVISSLKRDDGDILVFLPGRAEILRAIGKVGERLSAELKSSVELCPLYAEVGEDGQQRALSPATAGKRKVIFATTIAETSLTINGVRVVIDSGVTRVPRYDVRRGMTELSTLTVSQASADQRKGRAGREAPGVCYRLWPESESLPKSHPPEIVNADLLPLALELALWGTRDIRELLLLDYPPSSSLDGARKMLQTLGAIDLEGRITQHGKAMARLGVHPRVAHMVLRGAENESAALACEIAALLEERDVLSGRSQDVDLASRWHAFREARSDGSLHRTKRHAERLKELVGCQGERSLDASLSIGGLVALAFPDRIGMQRGPNSRRYLLSGGGGAELPEKSFLVRHRFLAVAAVDGGTAHAKIFLAEPVAEEELRSLFNPELRREREVAWDGESIRARECLYLFQLPLHETPVEAGADELLKILLAVCAERGIENLPFSESTLGFISRSEWARGRGLGGSTWPDLSNAVLSATCGEWLGPYLYGKRSLQELNAEELHAAVVSRFTRAQLRELDELAPSHYELPTGTAARIDYSNPEQPFISVLLQELFGARDTPKIGGGEVSLTVHLLSPARRPLQVTRDLSSFWRNAYTEVRKEMLGRYPKHHWPEDPLSAAPTKRAKPRR